MGTIAHRSVWRLLREVYKADPIESAGCAGSKTLYADRPERYLDYLGRGSIATVRPRYPGEVTQVTLYKAYITALGRGGE